jgi:uncharacterized membrane protein YsdA (DUF1294 family)
VDDIEILVCLIGMNLFSFILMGIDKFKARLGRWRISEKLLLTLAVLGASIGIWSGMYIFRHKTKKASFSLGLPLIVGVQILAAILIRQAIRG